MLVSEAEAYRSWGYTETAEGHLLPLQHPTTKTRSSLPNVAHEVAPEPTSHPPLLPFSVTPQLWCLSCHFPQTVGATVRTSHSLLQGPTQRPPHSKASRTHPTPE